MSWKIHKNGRSERTHEYISNQQEDFCLIPLFFMIYLQYFLYMDPQKVIDKLIQAGFYSETQKNEFLNDTSEMKSIEEIFHFIVDQAEHTIDDKKQLVDILATTKEIRRLFKPELQIWLIKAKIQELLGADVKQLSELMKVVDSSLRSKHCSRQNIISEMDKVFKGEEPLNREISQIEKELQKINYLIEELNQKQEIQLPNQVKQELQSYHTLDQNESEDYDHHRSQGNNPEQKTTGGNSPKRNPLTKEETEMPTINLSQNKAMREQIQSLLKKYQVDEEDLEDFCSHIDNKSFEEAFQMIEKDIKQEFVSQFNRIYDQRPSQNEQQSELMKIMKQYEIKEEKKKKFIKYFKDGQISQCLKVAPKKHRDSLKEKLEEATSQLPPTRRFISVKYNKFFEKIEYTSANEFKESLKEIFVLSDLDSVEFLLGESSVNYETLSNNPIKERGIEIIPKREVYYDFNGTIKKLWLSKNSNSDSIQKQILACVGNYDPHEITLEYLMANQTLKQIKKLEQDEIKYGEIKKINVDLNVKVTVQQSNKIQSYLIKSSDTIFDLKVKIEKDYYQIEAQSVSYESPEKIQNPEKIHKIRLKTEDNQKKIYEIIGNENSWEIYLKETHTVEFYGFHENRRQEYDTFAEFFIENQEEIQTVIQNSDFHDRGLESLFFSTFIKYIYSGIKKRFPIQTTLDKFKDMTVSLKSQNLWMPFEEQRPITMNQSFVENYLLFNSEEKLRITLMKLLADLRPLPMYFRKFSNIMNLEDQFVKNNQLGWVLKDGITILSLGLNNDGAHEEQKGKSNLLNQLFFTNFTKREIRNKICQSLPYIFIGVYQELFPLNIIDIPDGCPEDIVKELLRCSNLVIVHSWKSKEQTSSYCEYLQSQYGIQTVKLMRDIKFQGQDYLKAAKEKKIQKESIQLPKLENIEKSKSIINILRERFHQLLKIHMNDKQLKLNKIKEFTPEKCLSNIIPIIKALSKNSDQSLRILNAGILPKQEQLRKHKCQELIKKGLNSRIVDLIKEINNQDFTIEVKLDLFRENLRYFQRKQTNKFMKIYSLKEQIMALEKSKSVMQEVSIIHKQLLNLPQVYREHMYILNKSLSQISSIFDEITSEFENKIRPTIFSVELFWREIFAYLEIAKELQSNKEDYEEMINIVTSLKSKEIMNAQPFEIIDGDSLKMPKDIMRRVFKQIPDRCLVVTILGPQSSGKSTLLNFLFGCDFATSEGRCTRGVYGTYFRVNSNEILNFDGIFVIDTEGLFAVTNQKDAKFEHRQDFDSKLVLFCLAVSDIVIINVRGNLDYNTERILRICNQKLEALNKSEHNKPQIVIVLNQNSTSKTEESENQFKKIRKNFPFKTAKSLSLAYQIQNYDHQDISIFSENQVLTKKRPLIHFRKQTNDLLKEIITCMKQKKTAEKMAIKIRNFQQIWSTILAFPNLSKVITKQFADLEKQIKAWKKRQNEHIEDSINKIINCVESQRYNEERAQEQVKQLNSKYFQRYQKQFSTEKKEKQLQELVQNEKIQIQNSNRSNIQYLRYQIQRINLQKELNRQRFKGDCFLRDLENKIIKDQKQGKKYTQKQKEQEFNLYFKKKLEQIKLSIKLHEQCKNEEKRIKNVYGTLVKTHKSSLQQFGLINQKFEIQQQKWIQSTIEDVKKLLIDRFANPAKFEDYLEYNNKPNTNILSGGKTDAKLQYFNIKNYYQKSSKKYYKCLNKKTSLNCSLEREKLMAFFKKVEEEGKIKNGSALKEVYQTIYQKLKILGIYIQNFQNFKTFLQKENSLFPWPFTCNLKINLRVKQCYKPQALKVFIQQFSSRYFDSFFQITNLRQLFIWDHHKGYFKLKIEEKTKKIIGESIRWKEIMKYCKNEDQIQDKNEMNKILLEEINRDLSLLNCYLPENFQIVEFLQGYSRAKISFSNQVNPVYFGGLFEKIRNFSIDGEKSVTLTYEQYQQQQKRWNQLKYFNGKKIQKSIEQKEKQPPSTYIQIAKIEDEYLKPISHQFEVYNEDNSLKLKELLKSSKFKTFIFSELNKQKALTKFIDKIFKIIDQSKQKWKIFESKAIIEVFEKINSEIAIFNDDLNQVSYQLGAITMGRIHLMAIYTIWKYQVQALRQNETILEQDQLKSKQKELKGFLRRTSNVIDEQIEEQVEAFQQKILEGFKQYIAQRKRNLLISEKAKFSEQYKRKNIQNYIDIEIFGYGVKPENVLEYLENPAKVISQKYEEKYRETWQNIKRSFQGEQTYKSLYKNLEDLMKKYKEYLEKYDFILEKNGRARDIFEMIGKASDRDYEEEGKLVLFEFFLDRLLNATPDKERICLDLKLKLKNYQKLALLPQCSQITKDLLKKIFKHRLKITNLPIFVNKFLQIPSLNKFEMKLRDLFKLDESDRTKFINSVRVLICPQKSPCCGRICGLEQQGHTFHKCEYGHQMRGLAGNHLSKPNGKKQAYVVRCDQLEQTSIMQYNGQNYTWTQFKNYWSNKPVGGWEFDDVKLISDEEKKKIENAWLNAGPIFCQKNGVQFVSYTDAGTQQSYKSAKQQQMIENVHLIFALDKSGSMKGQKWEQLINAFKNALEKIVKHEKKGGNSYVTILTFNETPKVKFQRVKPTTVDMQKIKYSGGRTDFKPVFDVAAAITDENINQQTTVFVFMTDGVAPYPQNEITKFQTIMKAYPNKFIYTGIQFGESTKVMKNIKIALKGKNIVANNFEQLLKAYQESIEIIGFKESQ